MTLEQRNRIINAATELSEALNALPFERFELLLRDFIEQRVNEVKERHNYHVSVSHTNTTIIV